MTRSHSLREHPPSTRQAASPSTCRASQTPKGARAAKSGRAQEDSVYVRSVDNERADDQTHEERVEHLLFLNYCESKKARQLLQRNEYLMELLSERMNHLEWRSFLSFESRWTGKSLPASFKAWKHSATSVPSRDGEDRQGFAGSPMDKQDEERADKELPDEEIWAKLASMPAWIYEHDIEAAKNHRAYFRARSHRMDALQCEVEELQKLSHEQKSALSQEHFWKEQQDKAMLQMRSIVREAGEQARREAATAEAAAAAAAAFAETDESSAAAGSEQPERPAAPPRWIKIDL